ncbi:N-terminal cleavage protein [Leptotrichia sp. oral taxon 498]|nr:N-terminal cleavage protein [Leptotrichia sp. oral taxon 498]
MLSMFLFSVIVFVVSIFLKRVVIIEKMKKNNQKSYENLYFSLDKIVENLKNRDKEEFFYENEKKNIHIFKDKIVYKTDGILYKIEFENKKMYISDTENKSSFGSRTVISNLENLEFEKIGEILVIKIKNFGKDEIRVVKI